MIQPCPPFRSTIGLWAFTALCACARPPAPVEVPEADVETEAEPQAKSEELPELKAKQTKQASAPAAPRKVGDLWVHRFSGTYRDGDIIVEEEVLERQEDLLTVDYRFIEDDETHHLRVSMTERSGRIVEVVRIVGDREIPSKPSVYERLMARTTFAPDHNAGQVAESDQTCLIGPQEFDCEMAKYRVFVGDQEATLSVARNEELKRDLAGEITAVDGTTLYKAELIEMRRGQKLTDDDEAVASAEAK